jgi:mono/diheme cytochrome c family protein
MHIRLLVLASLGTILIGSAALARAPKRTTLDGVYTAAQAARGKAQFETHCVKCHSANLEGSDVAPPLTGKDFFANWEALTVNDLVDKIHTQMPMDNPGSLDLPTATAIASYILSKGGLPAGRADLPADSKAQAEIVIKTH